MHNLVKFHNKFVDAWQLSLMDLLLLLMRLYVAWIFFRAGLLKLDNWGATQYLFQYEYQVPILPWELAAYLAVATELVVPVFIALGMLTRITAFVLFVFNIVAVIAYPTLWSDGFELFSKGAMDHQIWGVMLMVLVLCGAGRWSLDKMLGFR
jgi:putative oxidoreductase